MLCSAKQYIIILLLFFLAYAPLYFVAWKTPRTPVLYYPVEYGDIFPVCTRNCFDTWEIEGY